MREFPDHFIWYVTVIENINPKEMAKEAKFWNTIKSIYNNIFLFWNMKILSLVEHFAMDPLTQSLGTQILFIHMLPTIDNGG